MKFSATGTVITGPGQGGIETTRVAYAEITNLSIGGPGKIQEGGGFIGGGFGLEGFAVGAGAAGVLNALTTRNRIETLIGLRTDSGELVFLCTSVDPPTLGLQLSRVRALVQSASSANQSRGDTVTQLEKLADLVDRGYLNRSEYDALKQSLLKDL